MTNKLVKQFETFIYENKEAHYRFAYSYVKNHDDACDMVSEAIVKALRSLKHIKNPEALKPWFYQILVRTSLDFLKKKKRQVTYDDALLEAALPAHEDHYEAFDLTLAIEQLPIDLQTVIKLRYFEEFKIEDIAQVMNENLSTTKSRLYSALRKLKISLGEGETNESI